MKKIIFAIMILVFLAACAPEKPVSPVVEEPVVEIPVEEPANEENDASMDEPAGPSAREISVRAFQFGYEPDTLYVDKGDRVIIKAHTSDVPHGMKIREFDFDMAITSKDPNNPDVAEFVASEAGEFSFYCSIPCGKDHKSMKGRVVVREK